MGFFELRTPRDMLEKAHREHKRLLEDFDIDNLFNFFVTAYHVKDYVKTTNSVPRPTLDAFLQDQDLKYCRDLCDKGKHLTLTMRHDPTTSTMSGCYGGAPCGALPYGAGSVWILNTKDRAVDVQSLADRVLEKWDAFFAANGL